MVAKSIIEIDVKDASWREFNKSFQKYQAAVAHGGSAWNKVQASFAKHQMQIAKMPATWGNLGKAVNAVVNPFVKMAAAASVMNSRFRTAPTYLGKMKVIAQSMTGIFDHVAKGSVVIAKNIGKTTLSLLKWAGITSIFSGLLGAGSLFGIDRLAGSAGNLRRQSQGLGVSSGELSSARLHFSKITDVDSALETIANTRKGADSWAFGAIGVDPTKGSNADLLIATLKGAKKAFARIDQNPQMADALGLTKTVDLDTLRRLQTTKDEEIDLTVRQYQADKQRLSVSDETLSAWQALSIQLRGAGQQIENTFIRQLVPLAGPLEKLSGAVSDAFATFLKNPQIGKWIDDLADGVQRFAKYLVSPEFKSDLDGFVESVRKTAAALRDLFGWIYDKLAFLGIVKRSDEPAPAGSASGPVEPPKGSSPENAGSNNPGNLRRWQGMPTKNGFAQFPDKETGIRAMAAQLQLYERRDHLTTMTQIIKKYAPESENDTGAYIKDVSGRTGLKPDEKLDLEDRAVLSRFMSGMTHHENAKSAFTPEMIAAILGGKQTEKLDRSGLYKDPVIIEIRNNTGGSASTTTNALAY